MQQLYNELTNYPGLTNQEIADALNRQTVTHKPVRISDIMAAAYATGLYARLVAVERDPNTPNEVYSLVKSLIDLKDARLDEIDVQSPTTQKLIAGLEQLGLLSKEERAQFEALSIASKRSRAGDLGLGVVTTEDIERAREWGAGEAIRVRAAAAYNKVAERLEQLPLPDWAEIVAIFEAA